MTALGDGLIALNATQCGALLAAVVATVAALILARATRSAMDAAVRGAFPIVDLELSWSYEGFRSLVDRISTESRVALTAAHSIDTKFALAYSIAFAGWLVYLGTEIGPFSWVSLLTPAAFSAGAFDVVENMCLQRCLRAVSSCDEGPATTRMPNGNSLNGPLHIAAIASAIKFFLSGMVTIAILSSALGELSEWIVRLTTRMN